MFQLTDKEWQNLRSQFVTSSWGGRRFNPYVFTEQGIAMLSGVLKNSKAVQVNILIMRAFIAMRRLMDQNHELRMQIEELESKYEKQFVAVFEAIRAILSENSTRNPIGFNAGRQ